MLIRVTWHKINPLGVGACVLVVLPQDEADGGLFFIFTRTFMCVSEGLSSSRRSFCSCEHEREISLEKERDISRAREQETSICERERQHENDEGGGEEEVRRK